MNKKLLAVALLGGMAVAQSASAQEYDDRWYLTGATGFNIQDSSRHTKDAPLVSIGLGKFISPTWSLDFDLNYQNPSLKSNSHLNWSQYGASFDLRRHFVDEGRGWNPYVLLGLGYQRDEEHYDAFPSPNSPGVSKSGNFAAKAGVGMQTTFDKAVAVRAELAYREDFDDRSIAGAKHSSFGDILVSLGVVIPLGPKPVAPPPPPPPAPTCDTLDGDGDGVNNCDDKCPDSQAGQTIGPDGCPIAIAIDLKGVHFDFDKSNLRPDTLPILNEAVEILKRYPDLRVEVAGNTDSIGPESYNMPLSVRRAKVVYEYLTNNGIDASRLVGPIGYGATRPIAPNTLPDGADNPEGRALNRRTELNVLN